VTTPRPYLLLALIAAVEGIALLINGAIAVFSAITGGTRGAQGTDSSAIIIEILIFAIFGVGLLIVAKGWFTMKRWARSPFVLAQLIGLFGGGSMVFDSSTSSKVPGLLLAVPAIIGLAVTFSPAMLRASAAEYKRPGSDIS
jgi:peptidoglycan/LPS O-acetylase OafA/YrhL